MASHTKTEINGIRLETDKPTNVKLDRLYSWVVWQYPRQRKNGHSGAVHPPIPGFGWFPAIIDADNGRVHIYAHLTDQFPTPELAAKHLDQPPTQEAGPSQPG
jgi:hypothetical protein